MLGSSSTRRYAFAFGAAAAVFSLGGSVAVQWLDTPVPIAASPSVAVAPAVEAARPAKPAPAATQTAAIAPEPVAPAPKPAAVPAPLPTTAALSGDKPTGASPVVGERPAVNVEVVPLPRPAPHPTTTAVATLVTSVAKPIEDKRNLTALEKKPDSELQAKDRRDDEPQKSVRSDVEARDEPRPAKLKARERDVQADNRGQRPHVARHRRGPFYLVGLMFGGWRR